MPHVIIRGLALGAMLIVLFGLVWAVNGDPNVAASFAGPMFSLLAAIAVVLATAIVERITSHKEDDNDD